MLSEIDAKINEIAERWGRATPKPWRWDANRSCKFVSLESNRYVVMGFKRYGTQGAQPAFISVDDGNIVPAMELAVPRKKNHPDFDMDIEHPDAQAIAKAPEDIDDLLQIVAVLRAELIAAKVCNTCDDWNRYYKNCHASRPKPEDGTICGGWTPIV